MTIRTLVSASLMTIFVLPASASFPWETDAKVKTACLRTFVSDLQKTISMNGLATPAEIAQEPVEIRGQDLFIHGERIASIGIAPVCSFTVPGTQAVQLSSKCGCELGITGFESGAKKSRSEKVQRAFSFALDRAPIIDDQDDSLIRSLTKSAQYQKAMATSMRASGCGVLKLSINGIKTMNNHQPMIGEGDDFFGGTWRRTVVMNCESNNIVGLEIVQEFKSRDVTVTTLRPLGIIKLTPVKQEPVRHARTEP